jgi:probable dihydroxyacetone kinase regulator
MLIKLETKNILVDSFRTLLKHKSFENISIQDIIDNCGSARSTFYRHFKDKYYLMNWFYKHHVDEIIKNNSSDYKAILIQCIYFVKENQSYFTEIIKLHGQNSFTNFLYTYSLNRCKEKIIKEIGTDEIPCDILFSLKFYTSGLVFMATELLNTGLKDSPEKISELIYGNMPESIKYYLN